MVLVRACKLLMEVPWYWYVRASFQYDMSVVKAPPATITKKPAVAVLRLEPTASQAIRSAAVEHHQGQLHRKLLGALKLVRRSHRAGRARFVHTGRCPGG
jgi:hypothetical protein